MSFERVPTPASVWEFQPTGEITKDDLIQVTYENGKCIFLARSDDYWAVDQSLMPNDLRIILIRYYGEELRLQQRTLNNTMSGYVGHPLTLRIVNDAGDFDRDVLCTSMSNVESIVAITRAEAEEDPRSYRSASHIAWPA